MKSRLRYNPLFAALLCMNAVVEQSTGGGTTATPAAPVAPPPVPFGTTKFYFKSRKEMQKKTVDGKEVEEEVTIPKPEAVTLVLPLLTVEDVKAIIEKNDEKEIALLMESVNQQIQAQARTLVDEDVEKARKDGLDNSQLSWNFIANIPPATRRGGGIEDAVWEAFIKDYTEVMQHHGKTKDKAETGAKILSKRFSQVKDNKKVIKALQENLMVWFSNTAKGEEFQQVYETLTSKADTLLAKDEEAILAAI